MTRPVVRHIVFTIAWLAASPAMASPYDAYGAGARGSAMGSAQIADAPGSHALHYNPSQLATAPLGIRIGALATFGRARILLHERPEGYDVPDIGPPARALGAALTQNERADSSIDNPLAGLTIGMVAPVVFDGLQAGLNVFLPMPAPVTLVTRYPDERERLFSNRLAFERFGEKAHQLELQFGLAYTVTDWLHVGVGAAYLPGFAVDTAIYLPDPTDQSQADIDATIDTENGFSLLAGLTVELPEDLAVGISFRDALAMRLTTQNEIQLNGVADDEPILQTASWTPIYTPAQFGVGVAWSPADWTVAADLRYTFWSTYEGANGEETDFNNVPSGAIGIERRASDVTALRAGLGFDPSPVPRQNGRTNYVDNHRATASIGAGHTIRFSDDEELEVSWFIKFDALLHRETNKAVNDTYVDCADGVSTLCDEVPDDLEDPETGLPFPQARGLQTQNPGFPGWVSGGWIGTIGAELRY